MPSVSQLLLFVPAAFLLLVVPGPTVLFIVSRSIDQGRRAGLVSVLGTHTGSLVHVAAAAVGLSALIVSSAVAFSAVKYVGAGYLVVLGVRRWRAGDEVVLDGRIRSTRHVFLQAFVVQLLNPKTAIFFLAFLPQFVDTGAGHVTTQVLVFGATFIALGLMSDSAYALAGSGIGNALRRSVRTRRAERYLSSGVFVGLGLTTALAGGHRTSA